MRSNLFLTTLASGALLLGCRSQQTTDASTQKDSGNSKPNVILLMSDDQGWYDMGSYGNSIIKTPHLDAMAENGIRFTRFYAAAPVCSPTRGGCITGRHPYRYGVYFANTGHMREGEFTLAEALKTKGYKTGHFGKWHLGTLTKTEKDANRGGNPKFEKHFAPPWDNGFDVCFSSESKVPTWNPMVTPPKTAGDVNKRLKEGKPFGTYYWTGLGKKVTENLEGDDSRVIMDRAIPFIREASKEDQPFMAVVWFHTPHLPVIAGPEYRALYKDQNEDIQHYYGAISALDEQIGRLRKELRDLGIADNTILFYTSDNGPEGKQQKGRTQGSTGPFKGRKRSLHEGGIRVPGLMEWPAKIKKSRVVDMSVSCLDYFSTIMEVTGFKLPEKPRPYDGISLIPLVEGSMKERPAPIGFESLEQLAWSDNQYKLYSNDRGETYELYDLLKDPGEMNDIADQYPSLVQKMVNQLDEWRRSCKASDEGLDY